MGKPTPEILGRIIAYWPATHRASCEPGFFGIVQKVEKGEPQPGLYIGAHAANSEYLNNPGKKRHIVGSVGYSVHEIIDMAFAGGDQSVFVLRDLDLLKKLLGCTNDEQVLALIQR